MRLFRLATGLVASALFISACGQSEAGSQSIDAGTQLPLIELTADEAMLTAAVDRTNELESFRFAMLIEMSIPNEEALRIEVDGAVDVAAGNASMKMDFGSMLDAIPDVEQGEFESLFGDGTIEMIQSGSLVYMKFPLLADLAGGGSDWVQVPLDATGDAIGLTGITFENPEDLLSGLADGGEVTEVGTEVLNGVATTKFQLDALTQSPDDASDFGAELFDPDLFGGGSTFVWIDDHGVVRRMEVNFSFFGIEGGFVVEFFDFGVPVVVDIPENAVVVDPAQLELFG